MKTDSPTVAPYIAAPSLATVPPVVDADPPPQVPASGPLARQRFYLSVRAKFLIAMTVSLAWFALTIWIAIPWMQELAALAGWAVAMFAIGGIALIPGFMNAFLVTSLAHDRRPPRAPVACYPSITILIAAYNEARSIADTIASVERQSYPGPIEVIVIDDGSTDDTADIVAGIVRPWLTLLRQPANAGKSAALNRALAVAAHPLVITLDADSYLHRNALANIVGRYLSDPADTRAVAGTMLVRNSRANWVTRMQEWDYFHGIAAIKRVQSMYQGTLVAQGAFSIYDRRTLVDVGGWAECVGEDIVLTRAILKAGWRVGHAEDAVCFTNAPERLGQFVRQRQRWARGMMEAFRRHPGILLSPRLSTAFVWWNLFFPWLDLAYTLFFIPGVLLALFGIFWIAGPLTLILLPLALLINAVMYRVGAGMFERQELRVRFNPFGFLTYAFAYSVILQPACVTGYLSEILGLRKSWGTK
ncbi:poly-beta-1,6-N-acetyl-D-glucosamine synthase [Rhizobiaceae bacterium]|nr:poly-beta-1,6-N-acetyl-D-glucosamine synthase [Rhizobiaceae bacterium]